MKTVLITGVLGGIGAAIARRFRQGRYYVYGLDKREDYKSDCHRFIRFDLHEFVRNAEYRIRKTTELDELVPKLNVLINNAAVQLLDPLEDITLDDWHETLNVNLTAPMLLSKLFVQRLEATHGAIINIGSIHYRLTKPRFVAYATSKGALVTLTKAMAVDLQGRVRVNCISPAAVETEMLRDGFKGQPHALDTLRHIHPVQRIGTPDDVARLAWFLAEEHTGFIHGANIMLDGGISSVLKDL